MINQEIDYYEDMKYQEFLLSGRRKAVCPPDLILGNLDFKEVKNIIDFGMGLGFFIPHLLKAIPKDAWLWGLDYQQDLIDLVLKRKLDENFENFTVGYIEKTDHPLIPTWIPKAEVIFSSMCISTFPDPGLAMDGLIRSMKPNGKLYLIDWTKNEFHEGPAIKDKISLDKMKYLAELYNIDVINSYKVNEFVYGLELTASEDFDMRSYDFRETAIE